MQAMHIPHAKQATLLSIYGDSRQQCLQQSFALVMAVAKVIIKYLLIVYDKQRILTYTKNKTRRMNNTVTKL